MIFNLSFASISKVSNDKAIEENNNNLNVYKNYKRFCTKLGHISCVYCLAFDRTGKHIITVWHMKKEREEMN